MELNVSLYVLNVSDFDKRSLSKYQAKKDLSYNNSDICVM